MVSILGKKDWTLYIFVNLIDMIYDIISFNPYFSSIYTTQLS